MTCSHSSWPTRPVWSPHILLMGSTFGTIPNCQGLAKPVATLCPILCRILPLFLLEYSSIWGACLAFLGWVPRGLTVTEQPGQCLVQVLVRLVLREGLRSGAAGGEGGRKGGRREPRHNSSFFIVSKYLSHFVFLSHLRPDAWTGQTRSMWQEKET